MFQPDTGVIDEKKSQNNLSPLYKDKDNTERTKKQSKHPKPHLYFNEKDQLTVVSGAYAVWMLYFVLKASLNTAVDKQSLPLKATVISSDAKVIREGGQVLISNYVRQPSFPIFLITS